MNHFIKRISITCLVAGMLTLTQSVGSSLSERSPFLPPDYGEEPTVPVVNPSRNFPAATFHGFSGTPGNWEFVIRDPSTNQTFWLKEGESKNSYSISYFNPDAQSITLLYNGMSKQFTLDDSPTPVSAPISRRPAGTVNRTSSNTNNNQGERSAVPIRRIISLPNRTPESSGSNNNNNSNNNRQGSTNSRSGNPSTSGTGRSNQVSLIGSQSSGSNNTNSGNTTASISPNNLISIQGSQVQNQQPENNADNGDDPNSENATNAAIPRRRFIPQRVDGNEGNQ